MAVYTKILYHIVWGTEQQSQVLSPQRQGDLFRFIMGKLQEKGCKVYSVGGYLEHLHILTSVEPEISLSELVSYLKDSTERWIFETNIFPDFPGWHNGFGAISCSWQNKSQLANYIENQSRHHLCRTFQEEMEEMLTKAGIDYKSSCPV